MDRLIRRSHLSDQADRETWIDYMSSPVVRHGEVQWPLPNLKRLESRGNPGIEQQRMVAMVGHRSTGVLHEEDDWRQELPRRLPERLKALNVTVLGGETRITRTRSKAFLDRNAKVSWTVSDRRRSCLTRTIRTSTSFVR